MTIDSDSLLVRVVKSFDHERDFSVTGTYRCDVVTPNNVTSTASCDVIVVINDVNDEAPHIKFSNSTTVKYDRLEPIEITGQVDTSFTSPVTRRQPSTTVWNRLRSLDR